MITSSGTYLPPPTPTPNRPKPNQVNAHRFNVDLDHGVAVSFSPDTKACVLATGQEFRARVYKLDVKKKVFEQRVKVSKRG